MCMICVDYQKGLLTASAARRNAGEVISDLRHRFELEELIDKTERAEIDRDLAQPVDDAPARYTFYVDVSEMAPDASLTYLNEVKKRFKQNN